MLLGCLIGCVMDVFTNYSAFICSNSVLMLSVFDETVCYSRKHGKAVSLVH